MNYWHQLKWLWAYKYHQMPVPRMWSISYLQHLFRTPSSVLSPAHARSASHSSKRAWPFVEFTPNIHQRKKLHHFRYIFRWRYLTSTSSRPVPLPFWWITSYPNCNRVPKVKVWWIHPDKNSYQCAGSEYTKGYALTLRVHHLDSLFLCSVSVRMLKQFQSQ